MLEIMDILQESQCSCLLPFDVDQLGNLDAMLCINWNLHEIPEHWVGRSKQEGKGGKEKAPRIHMYFFFFLYKLMESNMS